MDRFTKGNFRRFCDDLAFRDEALASILKSYGYPPMWVRPNSFETLVLTILEQQVSLASAYAAYTRLKQRLPVISPPNLLALSDEELRSCYFSRQKIVYTRALAKALDAGDIKLKSFETQEENIVRTSLKKLKGIGDWTVDVYLIHSLRRTDIFPVGDLALVNAVRMIKGSSLTKGEILEMAEAWRPLRTIATMMLWHYYIKKKNIRLLH